jgi:signal transduction histidine kinase
MRFVKMTWLNSLSVKILLAFVGGAVLSILLIVAIAVAIVYSAGDVVYGFDVAGTSSELAGELRFDKDGIPIGIGADPLNRDSDVAFDQEAKQLFESLKQEAAYRVLDASGKVMLSSAPGVAFWPDSGAEYLLKPGRFEFQHEGVELRGATESVQRDGRVWYVQFAISKRFLRLMYQEFALPFTGAGLTLFTLVLLLVFGPFVYFTLRYALKPVHQLSDAAAEISPRSLHVRLSTRRAVPREIAPFVDSFNRVLDRLEHGYRIQQEFIATAAHELKTPLALIRVQVELSAPSAQGGMLLQDVEHMSRQVEQLLHLAEASEVQNYRPVTVDMNEMVRQAAGYLHRMADAANVRLELPPQTVTVRWLADRGALFTLLKNLLENAIQHAPAGTAVSVEVDATSMTVRDWGPGVPQDQMSSIFARFWRGAHRRDKGAGLGMAICQEIAQAHGWTLTASQAQPGLRVVLERPATAAAEAVLP